MGPNCWEGVHGLHLVAWGRDLVFAMCVCARDAREGAGPLCVGQHHRTEQGRVTVLCRTSVSGRDERQRGPSCETIFIFQDTRSKKTRASKRERVKPRTKT